jgi:signal transduction histidine kinase
VQRGTLSDVVHRLWTVRTIAASSVLASVVTLVMSNRSAHPLPISVIDVAVIAAAAATLAVLLHERASDNGLWRVLLASAVVGPTAVLVLALAADQANPPGWLTAAAWGLDVPLTLVWVLFFGSYPDGKRPVRNWPSFVVGATAIHLAVAMFAWASAPSGRGWPVQGHLPWQAPTLIGPQLHVILARTSIALSGLLPLLAGTFLITRYLRSGPVIRQQIRVGAIGFFLTVAIEVGLLTLPGSGSWPVRTAASLTAVGIGVLAVASALLRWRLWIVDRALPSAVILSTVSAAITALIVLAVGAWTGRLGARQVQGTIPAAVLVSVLLQGYSMRLEPRVRRFVYGNRPHGFAVLVDLADGLKAQDPHEAARRIADATRRGLAVPWTAVWLPTAGTDAFELAGVTGTVAAAGVLRAGAAPLLSAAGVRLLAPDADRTPLPADTAAVASLARDNGDVWGFLAIAERVRDPLTRGDLELLEAIAGEATLAQENWTLHGEVEARGELLQERADQLRESRRRLVAAQDEERRRIERDLHDGAQHDLVSLAGRLNQLARRTAVAPSELAELAAQAEQAMFNLQDLARGIYPSVLTDRGVAAAIRSYVARLQFPVCLDIDAGPATQRWHKDLEIAFYYVTVEALGNSRKHADATETALSLSCDDALVTLRITDNGKGFEPIDLSERSGLQHMADRMSAVGGSLIVTSDRIGGTSVIARAPLMVPLRADGSPTVRSTIPSGREELPAPSG